MRLIVTHRGAPIGWFHLLEEDRHQEIAEVVPPEIRSQLDRTPILSSGEFTALPAFASVVSPLTQLSRDIASADAVWRKTLAQPPSPESRHASNAAWDQLTALERAYEERRSAVEQELEVHDDTGIMIPAVLWLHSVDPPSVKADFDEIPAAVVARLRRSSRGGGEIEPPAV